MAFRAKNYIKSWKDLAREIKESAGWKCEQCGVSHGSLLIGTTYRKPYKVVLSVAHLNHDTTDNSKENLRSLCQPCHLRLDRFQHGTNSRRTRFQNIQQAMLDAGQLQLDL